MTAYLTDIYDNHAFDVLTTASSAKMCYWKWCLQCSFSKE